MPTLIFGLRSSTAPIALMAALGIVMPASAMAQAYNWSGFYVGLHAGAAWGDGKLSSTASCPSGNFPDVGYFCDTGFVESLANATAVGAAGTGSANSTGFNGGVQAGYNIQSGNFLIGVEGDISSFGLKVSGLGTGSYPQSYYPAYIATAFTVGTEAKADWLGTLRGRLGWANGNVLLYVTGGMAFSEISVSNTFSDNAASGAFAGATGASSASKLKVGWALGGGGEFALNRNWTLKGEYLYVDLGSVSTTALITHGDFPGYSNGLTTKADINAHIGRVGVNYKF